MTHGKTEPKGLWPPSRMAALVALVAALAAAAWLFRTSEQAARDASPTATGDSTFVPMVNKSDAHWREQLTAEQFEITRRKGTERAFTGQFWDHKEAGTYKCVCCGTELFTSETKYDSECGWPSFFAADHPENLHTEDDRSYGIVRTEVMCKNCGAHLGHLFDDGPQPTGSRYCMNSAALAFEKKDAKRAAKDDGK